MGPDYLQSGTCMIKLLKHTDIQTYSIQTLYLEQYNYTTHPALTPRFEVMFVYKTTTA